MLSAGRPGELMLELMFNLLAVRAAAVPRLTRLLKDSGSAGHEKLQISDQLEHERTKAERGASENAMRRHNLLPVVFEVLKELGRSEVLGALFAMPLETETAPC